MENGLIMEDSKCSVCGNIQDFFAYFEVNEIAKCLDVEAVCDHCGHVAVESFDVEILLQSAGELDKRERE